MSDLLPSPTLIDRVVSYVSPERGVRRVQARAALQIYERSGYVAARRESTELQEWAPEARGADEDLLPGIGALRGRSRDAARNQPLGAGAIGTLVTGVVGSGLAASPAIDRERLQLSEAAADQWESRARSLWEAYWEGTDADLERERTGYELQALALRSSLESGDVLSLQRFRSSPSRRSGLASSIQLIEADRIVSPIGDESDGWTAGVRTDADGVVQAYGIADRVRTTLTGDQIVEGEWREVPAYGEDGERIARLLYGALRPGQRRGIPWLAPVILPLRQLDRYARAEQMAALVASMFTVFVRSASGSPLEGTGLPGIDDGRPGLGGVDDRQLRLGHGLVTELLEGEEIEIADPKRPNAAFGEFVLSGLQQIGAALELPHEVVLKAFSRSYSASRGALLEAWRLFRVRRQWMASHFCAPAYEAAITEAVARGILYAPGFFEDRTVRRAYLGVQWAGDSMPSLDPQKEVAAAERRIEAEISTRERESLELTGSSWSDNVRQRAKEERTRRDKGLADPDPWGRGA